MPKVCHYYITSNCNDTCEFCPQWQAQSIPEENAQPIKNTLRELRIKGLKVLNITGGEPLLHDGLAEIVQYAQQIGLFVELTTNGILYAEKRDSIKGFIDRLYFSLDYPFSAEHDRSRGVECFSTVIAAIRSAKEIGENPIINFTLTRDSVRFLPEMVDLAGKVGVMVNLNPVYDFYGSQGFDKSTLDYIRYYFRHKRIFLNLAALAFIQEGGNKNLFPRCRAQETTVTLLPDGKRRSPCFFNPQGTQGKEYVCSSCMRWPYMLPSFAKGVDKYFWLNFYSNWINRRKEVNL